MTDRFYVRQDPGDTWCVFERRGPTGSLGDDFRGEFYRRDDAELFAAAANATARYPAEARELIHDLRVQIAQEREKAKVAAAQERKAISDEVFARFGRAPLAQHVLQPLFQWIEKRNEVQDDR